MKRFLQFFFFSILIIMIFYIYDKYFQKKLISKNNTIIKQNLINPNPNNLNGNNQNNIIKNLKYEVNLRDNSRYTIDSEFSELVFINDEEIINMKKVSATYLDANNIPITIKSEMATYNTLTNNTFFEKNVLINYLDHSIESEKLLFDFLNNEATIFDSVVYKNKNNSIITDNIQINLISKDIKLYMDNPNNKKIEIYNN